MNEDVLRQLEYYFSDASFPFDEFMMREKDENNSIPASTLASYPRISTLTPELTLADRASLLMRVSAQSDSIIPVGDDRIGRRFPLPNEDPACTRSVCLYNVPKDLEENALRATLHDCASAKLFEPILAVRRLRNLKDRSFNGRVVVALQDDTKAAALVSADLPVGIVARPLMEHYKEEEEAVMVKRKRIADKAERKAERTSQPKIQGGGPPRGKILAFEGASKQSDRRELMAVCSAYGDVAFVDFQYGSTRGYVRFKQESSAAAAVNGLAKEPVEVSGVLPTWRLMGDDEVDAYWAEAKRQRGVQPSTALPFTGCSVGKPVETYGVVLMFEGAGETADRAGLASLCTKHGEVAYIDFERGRTSGCVRFRQPEAASAALAALTAEPADVGGAFPTWRMLTLEEEDAYKRDVLGRKRQREMMAPVDRAAGAEGNEQVASNQPLEVHGIVAHFDGVGGEASREELSELCSKYGEVAFIDFQRGHTRGYVRFRQPEVASAAIEAFAITPAEVGGACPTWRILSRDEEDEYKAAVHSRKRQREEGSEGKGGRGKGKGKGGVGRGAPRGWLGVKR